MWITDFMARVFSSRIPEQKAPVDVEPPSRLECETLSSGYVLHTGWRDGEEHETTFTKDHGPVTRIFLRSRCNCGNLIYVEKEI
jgi:hypothetical protein